MTAAVDVDCLPGDQGVVGGEGKPGLTPQKIGAYVEALPPHSGLDYNTPREVAATWKTDPEPLTRSGLK